MNYRSENDRSPAAMSSGTTGEWAVISRFASYEKIQLYCPLLFRLLCFLLHASSVNSGQNPFQTLFARLSLKTGSQLFHRRCNDRGLPAPPLQSSSNRTRNVKGTNQLPTGVWLGSFEVLVVWGDTRTRLTFGIEFST